MSKEAEEQIFAQPFQVDDGSLGFDGADWVLEGLRDERCHVVKRWSPDSNDPFRAIAWRLLDMAGRHFLYDEVY